MLAISHAATALLLKRCFPGASMAGILVAAELPAILSDDPSIGGTADPTSSVTDVSGLARTIWTLGPMLGTNHLLDAVTDPTLVTEIAAAVQLPHGASVSTSGSPRRAPAIPAGPAT